MGSLDRITNDLAQYEFMFGLRAYGGREERPEPEPPHDSSTRFFAVATNSKVFFKAMMTHTERLMPSERDLTHSVVLSFLLLASCSPTSASQSCTHRSWGMVSAPMSWQPPATTTPVVIAVFSGS